MAAAARQCSHRVCGHAAHHPELAGKLTGMFLEATENFGEWGLARIAKVCAP